MKASLEILLVAGLLATAVTAQEADREPAVAGAAQDASSEPAVIDLLPIPNPELGALEPLVSEALTIRGQELQQAIDTGDSGLVVTAYGEIGFLYHAHGLWQQALVAYHNAAQLAPDDPRWPYAAALAHREAGNLEAAATAYEASLDILADNPAGLAGLAEIRLEQNQPEWAKALLRHALKVLPESPAVLAVLGQVALSQERWAQAINYFERALSQKPEANRLHYPLALAYRGQGELEKAREHMALRGEVGIRPPDHIRDAIEERKTGERVMLLEGRRAFAAGRFAEAVALFEKALQADPASERARVNLAAAMAMAGDPQGALAMYRQILDASPNNQAALFNLGLLLRQQGDNAGALPVLEKAAAAAPDDAEVRLELARSLLAEQRLEEASRYADEAVAKQPANQNARLLAANLKMFLGRWQEARQQLEEAYRLMPDQGLIIHALARLLAASPDAGVRDGKKAVELASKVAGATGHAEHLETLALALAESARCAEAAEAQRLAIEAEGGDQAKKRLERDLERYRAGIPCRAPLDTQTTAKDESGAQGVRDESR